PARPSPRASVGGRASVERMLDLGSLTQQLPDEGHAFAALRLYAERSINCRHGTVFAPGTRPKVAIAHAITEAYVHSHTHPTLMQFIYLRLRAIRNIIYP